MHKKTNNPDSSHQVNCELTFDVSDDDHDEEAVVVGVVGVVNTGGDLTSADDLLQGNQHELDWQEGHALVEEVQRAVEDEVPVGQRPSVQRAANTTVIV